MAREQACGTLKLAIAAAVMADEFDATNREINRTALPSTRNATGTATKTPTDCGRSTYYHPITIHSSILKAWRRFPLPYSKFMIDKFE